MFIYDSSITLFTKFSYNKSFNSTLMIMCRNKTIRWHLGSTGRPYAIWISAGKKKGLMKVSYLFTATMVFYNVSKFDGASDT